MDYKKFSVDLAKKAGAIMRKNFTLGMKKKWQFDTSPLTVTDLVINELILSAVKKKFPTHGIFAEEEAYKASGRDYVWVCDPLDGTIPFSHGIPTSVFSLALVHRGESILGVIYDPFLDRLFFAEKGKGAFLNGEKISVSSKSTLKNSLWGVIDWKGSPYDLSHVTEHLRSKSAHIMNVNSIVYMGALVASGEMAGTIFPGIKPYDTAALKIIVEEAGGKVTDMFGNDQRYDQAINGHLISNSVLHKKLLTLIREHVRKRSH